MGFSGLCGRRKRGKSRELCLEGTDGGESVVGADGGGALLNRGDDDVGGRENSDIPLSRGGLPASDPNIDDIDMLLPGRFGGLLGGSRGKNEGDIWEEALG